MVRHAHQPAHAIVLALLATALFSSSLGEALTAKQTANRRVSVTKPYRVASGGIRGRIPIGYYGASTNRNGAYYLPPGYQNKPLPVLVILHGAGDTGSAAVNLLMAQADRHKFIIIAPESHTAQHWNIPATAKEPFTEDFYHVEACFLYVATVNFVKYKFDRIALAGSSRGGYSGLSLATRSYWATHAMSLHSSLQANKMGTHLTPIWVSTGTRDTLFTPARMSKDVAAFRKARPDLRLTWRKYSVGHPFNLPQEKEALIQWWYSTKGAKHYSIYS